MIVSTWMQRDAKLNPTINILGRVQVKFQPNEWNFQPGLSYILFILVSKRSISPKLTKKPQVISTTMRTKRRRRRRLQSTNPVQTCQKVINQLSIASCAKCLRTANALSPLGITYQLHQSKARYDKQTTNFVARVYMQVHQHKSLSTLIIPPDFISMGWERND